MSNDSFVPYTTIDDSNGYIYKHVDDNSSDWAGYIRDNAVYNWHGDYLGYAGNNGSVYDHNEHVIGWVDAHNGHVYNSAGVQVYDTTRGAVGAAAYLLCIYKGNIP